MQRLEVFAVMPSIGEVGFCFHIVAKPLLYNQQIKGRARYRQHRLLHTLRCGVPQYGTLAHLFLLAQRSLPEGFSGPTVEPVGNPVIRLEFF